MTATAQVATPPIRCRHTKLTRLPLIVPALFVTLVIAVPRRLNISLPKLQSSEGWELLPALVPRYTKGE